MKLVPAPSDVPNQAPERFFPDVFEILWPAVNIVLLSGSCHSGISFRRAMRAPSRTAPAAALKAA